MARSSSRASAGAGGGGRRAAAGRPRGLAAGVSPSSPPAPAPSTSQPGGRGRVAVVAGATSEPEQRPVDPVTGLEVEERSERRAVEAGGLAWSYLQAGDWADATRTNVLCLHGLLCSAASYREVVDGLGERGFNVVAPDWPGHGSSEVPSAAGGFDFSPAAYVGALEAFVAASPLQGRPFVLVTQGFVLGQVRTCGCRAGRSGGLT